MNAPDKIYLTPLLIEGCGKNLSKRVTENDAVYIREDLIKAEIERLHAQHSSKYDTDDAGLVLERLEDFLDSLESEKPRDLGERIGSYNIVPYIEDKIAKLQDMWREEKVSFDWDDLKDMIEDVARHFAQWGAEHLKK